MNFYRALGGEAEAEQQTPLRLLRQQTVDEAAAAALHSKVSLARW
jgi:hypothetical protein